MRSKFKLLCVAMIASESDIIESFARHTLNFVDHIHIQFHNSYDTSREIVERLIREQLPISFEVNPEPLFRREAMGTELARRSAEDNRFDFILPLDADEFIIAPDRPTLELELETAPRGGALTVNWLTYVPTEHDNPSDPNPITRIRYRKNSVHVVHKVFFAADVLKDADLYLGDGNHDLLSRSYREVRHRRSDRIFLGHFPIRSAPQLVSKVVVGGAARMLSPDFSEHQSKHWRALLRSPSVNLQMPIKQLTQYAIDYLDGEEQDLIEAPIQTSVTTLACQDLIDVDAFQRVAAFLSAVTSYGVLRAGVADIANQAKVSALVGEIEVARREVQVLYQDIRAHERARRHDRRLVIFCSVIFLAFAAYLFLSWPR